MANTVIKVDRWVIELQFAQRRAALSLCLNAGAVHDVLAKVPLPHLFCPLALHKDVFESLSRPSPLFSPLWIHTVCLQSCVCFTVACARGFVFTYNLYVACFLSCCHSNVQSPFNWTRYSCKVPTCSFLPLSPSQAAAAAQWVSSGVSLAWDPAGRGLTGLSVLAATCYLRDNALTHTTMLANHRAFSAFLLKGVASFQTQAWDASSSVEMISDYWLSVY